MLRAAKLLSFLLLWTSFVLPHVTVQDLIDSGEIKNCYEGNTLNLSHRDLISLRGIENVLNAASVRVLDLSYNQLKDLHGGTFNQFSNLVELVLNNNVLEDISELFEVQSNLHELHLMHNNLSTFDMGQFVRLPHLYVLKLGFNCVKTIIPMSPGHCFNNLEVLFLNNNQLVTLPAYAFASCPTLQALYLQDNMINDMLEGCFKGLCTMRLLYLYNNFIPKLSAGMFDDLHNLHVLYLKNNAIQVTEQGWDRGLHNVKIVDR